MAPDSALWRTLRVSYAVYAEPLSVSHCTAVSGNLSPKRFSTDPVHHILHGRTVIASRACCPVYGLHGRSSPARTLPAVFAVVAAELEDLNTSAYRFLPPLFVLAFTSSLWFVMQQITGYARSLSQLFGISQVLVPSGDVACAGCPTRVDKHNWHIADDTEDSRQYFCVCFCH